MLGTVGTFRFCLLVLLLVQGALGQTPPTLRVNVPNLPPAILGNTYGVVISGTNLSFPSIPRFTVTGGTAPFSFSVVGVGLPSGVLVNPSTGAMEGLVNGGAPANSTFDVVVRDARGLTGRVTVGPIASADRPELGFATTLGSSFRAQTRCGLPGASLSFNYSLSGLFGFRVEQTTGNIVGEGISVGTEAGSYSCTAPTFTLSWNVRIRVDPMPEFPLNDSEVGSNFSFTPTGFPAGTAPFTFAIPFGGLAPGLTLNTGTGNISGRLTTAGTYSWSLRRTEGNGVFRTFGYRLRVNDPSKITVTPSLIQTEVQYSSREPVLVSFIVQAPPGKRFKLVTGTVPTFRDVFRDQITLLPEMGSGRSAVTVSLSTFSWSRGDGDVVIRVDVFPLTDSGSMAASPDTFVEIRVTVKDKEPKLEVSPPVISRSFAYDDPGEYRMPITVQNTGGGRFPVSGKIEFYLGGGWARLVPPPAELGPGETRQFVLVLTPKGLEPGTYSADANITGTGQPMIPVRIVMKINAPVRELILEGSAEIITTRKTSVMRPVKVTIKNGLPSDRWTLSKTEPSDGPKWFRILNATGASGDSFQVVFDPTVVPPAKNSDADAVEVRLGDLARRGKIIAMNIVPYRPPVPWPNMVALGSRIRSVPREGADRSIQIYPQSVEDSSYLSTVVSLPNSNTGEPFFRIAPERGVVSGVKDFENVQTTKIDIRQVDNAISLPGFYSGAVIFGFRNAEDPQSREYFAPVRVVQLMGSIFSPEPPPDLPDPNAGSGLFSAGRATEEEEKCKAEQVIVFSDLPPTFQITAGSAVRINATAITGCGEPVTTGTMVARFSNGDPDLTMEHTVGGVWRGTWIPRKAAEAAAVRLVLETEGRVGRDEVVGALERSGGLPLIEASGIRHGAGLEVVGEIAPGMRLAIRGSEFLSGDAIEAPTSETVRELGGVSVYLGAERLPLLRVSSREILAVVPGAAIPDASVDLVIRSAEGRVSAAETLQVVRARPGVFLKEGAETQGQIFFMSGETRQLAEGEQGAERGSTVVIRASGLGVIGEDGKLSSPLRVLFGEAQVEAPVESVTVAEAGVYELAVKVPAEAPVGPKVAVLLDSNGMRSRAVTMAIR